MNFYVFGVGFWSHRTIKRPAIHTNLRYELHSWHSWTKDDRLYQHISYHRYSLQYWSHQEYQSGVGFISFNLSYFLSNLHFIRTFFDMTHSHWIGPFRDLFKFWWLLIWFTKFHANWKMKFYWLIDRSNPIRLKDNEDKVLLYDLSLNREFIKYWEFLALNWIFKFSPNPLPKFLI